MVVSDSFVDHILVLVSLGGLRVVCVACYLIAGLGPHHPINAENFASIVGIVSQLCVCVCAMVCFWRFELLPARVPENRGVEVIAGLPPFARQRDHHLHTGENGGLYIYGFAPLMPGLYSAG